MAAAERPRLVYRIVRTERVRADYFLSDRGAGRPLRDLSLEGLRRWEGFSVWDDLQRASAIARRYPTLGRFIAEIELPENVGLEPSRRKGHYTAYGEPDHFLRAVVRVTPVV